MQNTFVKGSIHRIKRRNQLGIMS